MDSAFLEYYFSRRRMGVSESAIRLELTQHGWQESSIRQSFQDARKEWDRTRALRFLQFFARIPKPITKLTFGIMMLVAVSLIVSGSTWWQDVALLGGIFFGVVYYAKNVFSRSLHMWATKHKFTYTQDWKVALEERLRVNPGKAMFSARHAFGAFPTVFIKGAHHDRNIWVYAFLGHLPYTRNAVPRTDTFVGVCVEIETGALPQPVAVLKKFVSSNDSLTTESRDFEKNYNVVADDEREALQLIDASMMSIILRHNISAIEFSDTSVALFTITYPVTEERLDALVDAGYEIAKQVDRNYPLGKYAKSTN